jgi:uncharacterized protein YecT (DUF1311 family)
MPADEADGPVGRAAALGFHSYADDTLRIVPETWSETGDEANPRDRPDAAPGRRGSAVVIAAGLALIAGIAVALAWSLTPGRRPAPEARPPAAAARPPAQLQAYAPPQAAPPAPRLQAEAAPPQAAPSGLAMILRAAPPFLAWNLPSLRPARPSAPPTAPSAQVPQAPQAADPIGERLAALAKAPPIQVPNPAQAADPIGERLASLAQTPVARTPAPAPQPEPAQASDPASLPVQARVQPAFDCAAAGTAAEQMVCGDPELAAADRRMNRAYRAALDAGAPEDQLRSEQQDWLGIREDAARHSRRAVASIYEQRIDELRRWRADAVADHSREP